MLRAKDIRGRPVVDMDTGSKLGQLDDLLLDPGGGRVAGYVVSHGPDLFRRSPGVVVPASAIHAIGHDVITVRRDGAESPTGDAATMPRLSHIVGRKVVSEGGAVLGAVEDALLEDDGTGIIGYALEPSNPADRLEALAGRGAAARRYVRADTSLRVGHDVIVAPDDAVVQDAGAAVENDLVEAPRRTPDDRHGDYERDTPSSSVVVERDRVEQRPPGPRRDR